jgi:hypothetical protein
MKVAVNFDPHALVRILLSENKIIRVQDLKNIYKLVSARGNWDGSYRDYSLSLYEAVFKEVFSLAGQNITKRDLVLSKLFQKFVDDGLDEDTTNKFINTLTEVSTETVEQTRLIVQEELENLAVIPSMTKKEDLIVLIKSSSGATRSKYLEEYKILCTEEAVALKKVNKVSTGINSVLMDGTGLTELIGAVHSEITSPSVYLSVGNFTHDKLLGGGLSSGSTYYVGMPSGHGKSSLMLEWALGVASSNKNVLLKDKTKIPFVLYLSFENKPVITGSRIIKKTLNLNKEDVKLMDRQDLSNKIDRWFSEKEIKFQMDYYKSYTLSPEEVGALIHGRTDEFGREMECIALFVDYLFLLSKNEKADYRLEISQNMRKIADIGVEEGIPTVTAGQLTADAERSPVLDKMNLAEAKGVIDHVDWCMLSREQMYIPPIMPDHHLLAGKHVTKLKYHESYIIKSRSAEDDFAKGKQLVPFSLTNNFLFANDMDDSTFAIVSKETLLLDLDKKYKALTSTRADGGVRDSTPIKHGTATQSGVFENNAPLDDSVYSKYAN